MFCGLSWRDSGECSDEGAGLARTYPVALSKEKHWELIGYGGRDLVHVRSLREKREMVITREAICQVIFLINPSNTW